MKSILELLDGKKDLHIVMTDSGLGGLNICAGLEARLRGAAVPEGASFRLTFVNAWPFERHGYNAMPDPAERAAVFDRALAAIAGLGPDLILIACNTLSVLYGLTEFSRAPSAPVAGIIDEGAALFYEALVGDPDGTLIIFGTRTTVLSGEHARRLAAMGIGPERIRGAVCHGLAGAIDRDPGSPETAALLETCVARAVEGQEFKGTVYAGLCCTHYSYIADEFRKALETRTGRRVAVLDPAQRFIDSLTAGLAERTADVPPPELEVGVVSKVELKQGQREAIARRLERTGPWTAGALIGYTHRPELF